MKAHFNELPNGRGTWRNLSTDSRIDLYTDGETVYIIPNDEKPRAGEFIGRIVNKHERNGETLKRQIEALQKRLNEEQTKARAAQFARDEWEQAHADGVI